MCAEKAAEAEKQASAAAPAHLSSDDADDDEPWRTDALRPPPEGLAPSSSDERMAPTSLEERLTVDEGESTAIFFVFEVEGAERWKRWWLFFLFFLSFRAWLGGWDL